MNSFSSTSHIRELYEQLPQPDDTARSGAAARQDQLTKPPGSLGRLEQIALWMASWQETVNPQIEAGKCLVFAGNHGVVKQGISPFPPEVTQQMVWNFEAGGAAINQLCETAGLELAVTALDLNRPTIDFSTAPAMDPDEVLHAMNAGAAAVGETCDYLIVGEMGIGNTTAAAALCMALFGGNASGWGFISSAAAATLTAGNRLDALDHCMISHLSPEPGHMRLASALRKQPFLDLRMRLGEASGAAVATLLVRAALATHNGMATFDEAGVSKKA